MEKRPELGRNLSAETFKEFYYLKSELVEFCKENKLQTGGGKIELTERVFNFLKTGEKETRGSIRKKNKKLDELTLNSLIEKDMGYGENIRAFYELHLGKNFKFCVPFQRWLKGNVGKTFQDSIEAYKEIIKNKDKTEKVIDRQFEYNTYIRDFFKDNKNKTLKQAICCWKYNKSIKGSNKYERSDLCVLSASGEGK